MTDYAEGLGSFPIGGFPDSESLSISDPLAGLLADPTAPREFLLRAKPGAPAGLSLHDDTLDIQYAVDYGDVLDQGATDSFTVEVLAYQTNILFGKADHGNTSEAMWYVQDGSATLSDGTHNVVLSGDATPYQDGNCHRFSLVVDRTAQLAILYIDGNKVASGDITAVGSMSNAYHLIVGTLQNLTVSAGRCAVSDFRFFPYARSQAQVQDNAFARLSPSDMAACALLSVYDAGSGSSVVDSSGHGKTGTVVQAGTAVAKTTRWLPTIGTIGVDLSSGGYVTAAADSPPSRLFRGALKQPYTLDVNLPTPALCGGAAIGVGQPVINNPDGLRDPDAMKDWLGASSDIYVGKHSDPLTLFTRIFHGVGAGVKEDIDSWTLLHRDARYKLATRLQKNRYRGTGACIRVDGASGYVGSGAFGEPTNSMTLEALIHPTTTVTGGVVASFRNGAAAAGLRNLSVGNGTSAIARFQVRNDANTQFLVDGGTVIASGQTRRISGVLDTVAMELRIYVDGVLDAAPVAVTGTFTTVIANFDIGRNGGGGNLFTGDIDDVRIWSTARTQQDIYDNKDQELTGGEAGLVHYYKFNEASGATAADSVGGGVNLTVNAGATWASLCEGDAAIAGKPKPLRFGVRRQVEAICVDAQNLIYQVHDGSCQSIDAVRVGCDPFTLGTDRADPFLGTPAASKYDSCKVRGLIRLGSAPGNMKVTVDCHGDNSGSLGYSETAAGIHRKIITQWGGFADPADLDTTTYTALAALQPASVGYDFMSDINIDAALDTVMAGVSCWWAPNRVGWSTLGRIDAPESLIATVNITQDDIVDPDNGGQFEPTPLSVRVGAVIVGYRPYGVAMSPTEIAGTVALAARTDFGQQFRYTPAVKDPNASPLADTITVLTALDNYADALAEARRLLAMLKVDRKLYTLDLDSGILSYFLGTVFNFTHPRYELAWGKNMIVIGLSENMGDASQQTPDSLRLVLYG